MARIQTLVIPGKMPGLNEMLAARGTMGKRGRSRYNKWSEMNNEWKGVVVAAAAEQGIRPCQTFPLFFVIKWVCPDRRRDKDNVAAAKKMLFDGLTDAGVIPNDTWVYVGGWSDQFSVDAENPRVEIKIVERRWTSTHTSDERAKRPSTQHAGRTSSTPRSVSRGKRGKSRTRSRRSSGTTATK